MSNGDPYGTRETSKTKLCKSGGETDDSSKDVAKMTMFYDWIA
jgi:hypothetical protein